MDDILLKLENKINNLEIKQKKMKEDYIILKELLNNILNIFNISYNDYYNNINSCDFEKNEDYIINLKNNINNNYIFNLLSFFINEKNIISNPYNIYISSLNYLYKKEFDYNVLVYKCFNNNLIKYYDNIYIYIIQFLFFSIYSNPNISIFKLINFKNNYNKEYYYHNKWYSYYDFYNIGYLQYFYNPINNFCNKYNIKNKLYKNFLDYKFIKNLNNNNNNYDQILKDLIIIIKTKIELQDFDFNKNIKTCLLEKKYYNPTRIIEINDDEYIIL